MANLSLQQIVDYFFGNATSPDHLDKLGLALSEMDTGTDPVQAINDVLTPDKVGSAAAPDIQKLFSNNPYNGRIHIRKTLEYFLQKLNDYPPKMIKSNIPPPPPWQA